MDAAPASDVVWASVESSALALALVWMSASVLPWLSLLPSPSLLASRWPLLSVSVLAPRSQPQKYRLGPSHRHCLADPPCRTEWMK